MIILSSVGMAPDTNSTQRAREAVLREDLFRMRDAIGQFYADKNRFPASLQDLVSEKYLRDIPKDPITDSPDTWWVENAARGITDVKSGSDATAMDGTKYADWD